MLCFFASDLHGSTSRYDKLFEAIEREQPDAVFLGGDLLPSFGLGLEATFDHDNFLSDKVGGRLAHIKELLGDRYPSVFAILGNDDPRFEEAAAVDLATRRLWTYAHERRFPLDRFEVYGYGCIPPSPFRLKDWERYDVSRYADPGCIPPEDGAFSVTVSESRIRHTTIQKELAALVGGDDLSNGILLFHTPPYQTALDRAALDGKTIDHVPLDVHVGSIAVKRLIEERQPRITLHGHVHEAVRLTGIWKQQIGTTWMFGGAHDGPELALVRFDPQEPSAASRELL